MSFDFYEILERAESGPLLAKEDWDFYHIVLPTRELVDKYKLRWDPQVLIPDDSDLIERVFQAGFELASRIGLYYLSTGRVIRFDRDELEAGLRGMPTRLTLGEGRDARKLRAREITDSSPPLIWAGNPGAPTPERIFLPMVKSWMQEEIVDLVTCGSLPQVDGQPVVAGEPTEILATRRELSLMREGLRQVGRPGMGMLAAQSSITELGDLSVAQPDYLRPCDSHLVPLLNELIIDRTSLARVANSLDYGMRNASLACVMVGGLAGDASGAAVVQVASFILANLACRADYHLLHPIHIRHISTSTRSVLWVQSVVSQAFAQHAPCIIVGDIYPKSGALTRELLYEVAANAIVLTLSGAHLEGVGAADGALPNASGLEARWMGEIGHAVTRQGLTPQEANAMVLRIIERYEHVFKRPGGNPGVPFDQVYDLDSLNPRKSWLEMYSGAKAVLTGMGLALE